MPRIESRSVGGEKLDTIDVFISNRPPQYEPFIAIKLTFLDAVFLWSLVGWVLVLLGNALGALIVVVLQGSALSGLGALCRQLVVSSLFAFVLGLLVEGPMGYESMTRSLKGDWSPSLPRLQARRMVCQFVGNL